MRFANALFCDECSTECDELCLDGNKEYCADCFEKKTGNTPIEANCYISYLGPTGANICELATEHRYKEYVHSVNTIELDDKDEDKEIPGFYRCFHCKGYVREAVKIFEGVFCFDCFVERYCDGTRNEQVIIGLRKTNIYLPPKPIPLDKVNAYASFVRQKKQEKTPEITCMKVRIKRGNGHASML